MTEPSSDVKVEENNEVEVKAKGFYFSFNIVILILAVSVAYLLTVGLVSGLVFRKINVCDPESGAQGGDRTTLTSTTTTTTRITTTTTTSPSTTPSTSTTTTTNTPTTPSTTRTTTTTITTPTTPSTTTTTTSPTTPSTPSTTTTTTQSTTPSTTPSTTTTSTTTTTTTTTTPSTTSTTTTTTPTTPSTSTTTTTITTTTLSTTTSTSTSTTTDSTATRTLPTLSTLSTTTTQPVAQALYENPRLPDFFEPSNYNVKLRFYFTPEIRSDDGTGFDGEIDMYFRLKNASREILFHADPFLEILDPIRILNIDTNETTVIVNELHQHVKNEYYYINASKVFVVGNYKISLSFKSKYNSLKENRGIFVTTFLDDYIPRSLLATSFAPTDARRAFPCFDEPQLKATYDITIQHPLNSYAISNSEVLGTQVFNDSFIGDPYIETKFKRTPKLSTHSIGWVVVPTLFTYVEARTINGIPVRVYGKDLDKRQGLLTHALDVAKRSIDYLERTYLDNSDPVSSKIDLIAIGDYPYETQDSWGIGMFRESSILYSSSKDAPVTKQITALAVAQHIASLWFGNVVTCDWWNDFWFNKASASYLKYKVVSNLFPEFDILNQIVTEETVPVMWEDGFASSHPLQVKVLTRGEIISSVFDKVTSSKGAAVMRMVESVVGATAFQNGFRNYVNRNKFSSGVLSDFFGGFSLPASMSSTTPARFLLSWVQQMNYPVVEIKLTRQSGNTVFGFYQDRFLLTNYDEEVTPIYTSPFNYTWQILLKCKAGGIYNATGGETQHLQGSIDDVEVFLDKVSTSVTRNGRQYTWIKCNPNFESYYATEYTKNIFEGFVDAFQIAHTAFTVGDRANLIHNAFQLAYKGDGSYSVPASLVSYLSYREKDYLPWKVFTYHVDLIADILEHRPVFKQLALFGESIVDSLIFELDIYVENGVTNKPHLQSLLEANAVEFLCRLQEEYCLNKMSEWYSKLPEDIWLNPNEVNNPIPANIRSSVYKYHLQNTYNYNDWFDIYQLYELAGDAQEKKSCLSALGASRSTWLLNLFFAELLDRESHVKKQDFFEVLDIVSSNPSGRHLGWYFYRHYWDELVELFGIDDFDFGQSIKFISSTFENKFFLEEMWDFFASHPNAGAAIFARQQAIDIVENNIIWILDRESDVAANLLGPLKVKSN